MISYDAFDALAGNSALKERLLTLLEADALPHALILEGASGTGKLTLARLVAASLCCRGDKKPCLKCSACARIITSQCPDVGEFGLSEDKKTIGVDTVRLIKDSAYLAPDELERKVYILRDSDKMTTQAQNALLKLLEEPPRNVYFILLAQAAALLLPTVRSRAPVMRMQLFSPEELDELLCSRSKKATELKKSDPESYSLLINSAGGSLGAALAGLDGRLKKSRGAAYEKVCGFVAALLTRGQADFLAEAYELAQNDRNALNVFCGQLCLALRDLCAVKRKANSAPKSGAKNPPEPIFYTSYDEALNAASRLPLKKLLAFYESAESFRDTAANINVNIFSATLAFAERMWEIRAASN